MDCHSDDRQRHRGFRKDGGLVGLKFVKTPGPGLGSRSIWRCTVLASTPSTARRSTGRLVGVGVCWGQGQGQLIHRGLLCCAGVYAIQGQR